MFNKLFFSSSILTNLLLYFIVLASNRYFNLNLYIGNNSAFTALSAIMTFPITYYYKYSLSKRNVNYDTLNNMQNKIISLHQNANLIFSDPLCENIKILYKVYINYLFYYICKLLKNDNNNNNKSNRNYYLHKINTLINILLTKNSQIAQNIISLDDINNFSWLISNNDCKMEKTNQLFELVKTNINKKNIINYQFNKIYIDITTKYLYNDTLELQRLVYQLDGHKKVEIHYDYFKKLLLLINVFQLLFSILCAINEPIKIFALNSIVSILISVIVIVIVGIYYDTLKKLSYDVLNPLEDIVVDENIDKIFDFVNDKTIRIENN